MLIKALCDYADKQAEAPNTDKIPDGFGKQTVHFRIVLSENGDLKDIIPITETNEKKKASKEIILPIRTQKPGIESNFIEHRPLYIFGLNYEKDAFSPDDKTDKARKSHAAFVKHELEFFERLDSPVCKAYKNFVKKWIPENETENPILRAIGKDYKNSYFGFSLGAGCDELEADEQFVEKYKKSFAEKSEEKQDEAKSVCGILGEKASVARLHDKIKFPGGQASGCPLVCMKESAYESYGKTQSFNSNVSEKAMKKYTSTFNKLLSDRRHYTVIGDMVLVYFAMKNDDSAECSIFSAFLGNIDAQKAEDNISSIVQKMKSGFTTDDESIQNLVTDDKITFYIAGLTPNSSRICQKFIYRGSFGEMLNNLIKHQKDLSINENNSRPVYFSSIAKELKSPKSTDEKIPPPLMANIMLAALNNTKYPDSMLSTIIRRIKTDNDEEKKPFIKLNDTRAGIIKACLNRKYKKEEITMAWNEENKNPAYLCGGLFAVYEKIQQEASGGNLNRTIKDAYFASACSRPSSVFPKLAKLAQNHMRKLGDGAEIYFNKMIGNITNSLDGEFPSTLSLDDQGRFIVGYYQMNKRLYTSTKDE